MNVAIKYEEYTIDDFPEDADDIPGTMEITDYFNAQPIIDVEQRETAGLEQEDNDSEEDEQEDEENEEEATGWERSPEAEESPTSK